MLTVTIGLFEGWVKELCNNRQASRVAYWITCRPSLFWLMRR